MTNVTWDQTRIDTLKSLWASGFSASECAARMGISSRSAILGKVHRLRLPHRTTQTRSYARKSERKRDIEARESRPRRKRSDGKVVSPVFARDPLPPEPVKPEYLYSLTEITDREDAQRIKLCRYIFGNPKGSEPWGYCGCEAAPGSSYCAGHHAMVFSGAPEVQRRLDRKPMFVCTTRFGHAKEVAV